ncbi:hypothetical protein EJ04DRAFT_554759 [Polyplosphaeria fusca]|uniref:Uncharacterized protein n=1 Tax=Polyplosphaeria fusca TaxID=682080 RepID=A0A9P4QPM4_9PLEO|nr:hypothetical protein EJ04DRAFT_554759 [Polyplosphaeria fusca]
MGNAITHYHIIFWVNDTTAVKVSQAVMAPRRSICAASSTNVVTTASPQTKSTENAPARDMKLGRPTSHQITNARASRPTHVGITLRPNAACAATPQTPRRTHSLSESPALLHP